MTRRGQKDHTIHPPTPFCVFPPQGVGASGDGQLGSEGPDRGAAPGEAAADGDAQPPPAHLHREDRQRQNPRGRGQPPAGAAVRPRRVKPPSARCASSPISKVRIQKGKHPDGPTQKRGPAGTGGKTPGSPPCPLGAFPSTFGTLYSPQWFFFGGVGRGGA